MGYNKKELGFKRPIKSPKSFEPSASVAIFRPPEIIKQILLDARKIAAIALTAAIPLPGRQAA
jgi:hypothetical protein